MSLLGLQQAVVDDLTASFSFTAEKAFTPEITLQTGEDLRVIVVPLQILSATRMNRNGKWEEQPQIQVGVVQRIQPNAGTPVSIEDVLEVAESIRTHYQAQANAQLNDAGGVAYYVMNSLFIPFYDYPELDDSNQVVSIIQITFKEFTI